MNPFDERSNFDQDGEYWITPSGLKTYDYEEYRMLDDEFNKRNKED